MADASQEETAATLTRKLEAVFGAVQRERMDGIPILNPKLAVAAIGMRASSAGWLCVLVTPWFINGVLLPATEADAKAWAALPIGTKIEQTLPSGVYEFICGAEEALGPYRICSLFSPVLQFEDQDAALATAEAAIAEFFNTASEDASSAPPKGGKPQVNRRSLLFGRKAPAGERQ
jgi:[NiFe] hydrogenase assembly HybE family chaperone